MLRRKIKKHLQVNLSRCMALFDEKIVYMISSNFPLSQASIDDALRIH